MINKIIYSTLIVLMLMLSACTKDFDEINSNPNGSTEISTGFLLTNAQKRAMDSSWDEWWNGRRGNQLAQYWASNQYSNESRYALRVDITNSYWTNFYAGVLQDLTEIIRLNEDFPEENQGYGSNANQIAVSKIMKTWLLQNMTDQWGDIPFTEANKGVSFPSPAYDSQEGVYDGLIAMLDEAINTIDGGAGPSGDQIFGGDMSKWAKFANSLKLRLAMRIADVDADKASTVANEAVSAGVFGSNADNALFEYLGGAPNNNPLNQDRITRNDFAASNILIDELLALDDPRIEYYAEPALNSGTYVGEVYGLTEADAATTLDDDISQRSQEVLAADAPGIYMDYASVQFFLAEAVERGFIAGSASDYYSEGIRASMEYWSLGSLTSDDINTYLAKPEVDYATVIAGSPWNEVIGKQKWLALYMQGMESWTEWRRLDFGILQDPAGGVLAGSGIPARMLYPTQEYDRNGNSVSAAASSIGGDLLDTKLWWDAN
tara:strand:+ start:3028 stop:4500 length:1473 start_codon:yes stop_codon:yes gene_type:complete